MDHGSLVFVCGGCRFRYFGVSCPRVDVQTFAAALRLHLTIDHRQSIPSIGVFESIMLHTVGMRFLSSLCFNCQFMLAQIARMKTVKLRDRSGRRF